MWCLIFDWGKQSAFWCQGLLIMKTPSALVTTQRWIIGWLSTESQEQKIQNFKIKVESVDKIVDEDRHMHKTSTVIQDIQKDRNGCYGYGRVLKDKKRNIADDPQSKLGKLNFLCSSRCQSKIDDLFSSTKHLIIVKRHLLRCQTEKPRYMDKGASF